MTSPPPAESLTTRAVIEILLVSGSDEDFFSLGAAFRHSHWKLNRALSCKEARELLGQRPAVVVCAAEVADGGWKDLLYEIAELPRPPRLIVFSRLADDRLWAEVLNLGGYDVLEAPFVTEEVVRVVSAAWRSWRGDGNRPAASPTQARAFAASSAA